MARMRGMAFLGAAHHIKHTYGAGFLTRIVDGGGPETQKAFEKKINGLALYPYAAFVGLLRSFDRQLGAGDLMACRTVGDIAARHDLQTIFKGYAVRPEPEEMIRACSPIWGMYTEDAGHMVAVETRPENTMLRIHDFPDMDPAHCQLMQGWMIAAMDFVGARVMPGACERLCMSHGDPAHEFWCRWEPKTKE